MYALLGQLHNQLWIFRVYPLHEPNNILILSMKNTVCPSFLIMDTREPNPNGCLLSFVKKGLFSGAADVVNSMFMYLPCIYTLIHLSGIKSFGS